MDDEKRKQKVLILKTGYSEFLDNTFDFKSSLGDVLRSTPILHLFKEDYVTWATDSRAIPLLEGNPYIDRLMVLDWLTEKQLRAEHFDVCINLEKHPGICILAGELDAIRRYGFAKGHGEFGIEAHAYEKASEALSLSLKPHLKRQTNKSFQELLFDILGKKWNKEEYILGYNPSTQETYDVCLNTNIGGRWPTKAWPKEKWDKLEQLLISKGLTVTRQDKQNNKILTNLYHYIDWVNCHKIVISNDSLGMHLGIVLRKKVLGFFGPTSHSEVYFYGRGKAIIPKIPFDCMPCMSGSCDKYFEGCIQEISPEEVFNEVLTLLDNPIKI
ncbi:MAG: glycosyltransferase family 9 protein [archaeon]